MLTESQFFVQPSSSGLLDPSGSLNEAVFRTDLPELRKQEIKYSIQKQYFRAAEKGKISYLKAWRVMRGMDQATLAATVGMSQPEVSRAERPGYARRMKGENLLRLARALHVKIEDLLG